MIVSLVLISLIAIGGSALTYLFTKDEPLLWRLSAGSVIGSAIFGTCVFGISLLFGFGVASIGASLIITLLPLIFVWKSADKKLFEADLARAKGKLQGANAAKFLRFAYYAAAFVFFIFFFDQTMKETVQGILTGGSNNLGDLPYHLGAISAFTEGAAFPPDNPSFAGAKFSYPFISDLTTACFVVFGANVRDAMLVQNVVWAFSLLVILERFVLRLLNDNFAAKLAPFILFLSGGLGFLWFFDSFMDQGQRFFEFIWALPTDYTIGDNFRWGNSLTTLFLTQRSLLLGMPITLVVLELLWQTFISERDDNKDANAFLLQTHGLRELFFAGLIAGLLPLVHLHSLAILFIVTGFLFILRLDKWRVWLAFGLGVCITALPLLAWSMTGSANDSTKFFGWHFGWDSREHNIIWFWIKNTGLVLPLIAAGAYLVHSRRRTAEISKNESSSDNGKNEKVPHGASLLLFYLPFLFLFLLANTTKLAPWEWDNIKVLIYWFVGSIPFVAFVLSRLWKNGTALKIAAALCFFILIFSGSLDVWRTVSGQIKMTVFNPDAVRIAEAIKKTTPRGSVILNAPTYNSAIALTGRRSLMRYPGHLASHGIDYGERERDLKAIYSGGASAMGLINKYGIDLVLVSPEEKGLVPVNDGFFLKFPVVAEAGQYKVYKVR